MMFSLHRVAGWPPPAPLLRLRPPIRHLAWVAVPRPLSILAAARVESASSSSFDPEAFEAERLRLDAEARASMAAAAAATSEESAGEGGDPKAWKWKIRKRVWDLMEAENIARNPRPVHHRIPNFDGAAVAADALGKLDVFEKAQCVKVNPDSPQKQVRFLTLTGLTLVVLNKGNHGNRWRILVNNISRFVSDSVEPIDEVILTCSMELTGLTLVVLNKGNHGNRWHILVNNIVMVNAGGKKLLTPQPRLRTGFFSVLESKTLPSGSILEACTSVGAAKYGRPIGLDEKIKVDLIVIGSVAVDPRTGARLGKGEGFAELEYGMLRYMEAIDDNTMIVTSVHDKQLVSDVPVEKLLVHDVPVDIICTPTQIIYTDTTIPKPQGIYWDKLSPEKLGQIRILRELKKRIERETGQVLPTGPSEKLPPTARRRR